MVALVETIWLFVRDHDSVRMIRATTPDGGLQLLVYGPGNTEATYDFRDPISCNAQASQVQRRLTEQGYTLDQFTDRRSGADRRATPRGDDRRRGLRIVEKPKSQNPKPKSQE